MFILIVLKQSGIKFAQLYILLILPTHYKYNISGYPGNENGWGKYITGLSKLTFFRSCGYICFGNGSFFHKGTDLVAWKNKCNAQYNMLVKLK